MDPSARAGRRGTVLAAGAVLAATSMVISVLPSGGAAKTTASPVLAVASGPSQVRIAGWRIGPVEVAAGRLLRDRIRVLPAARYTVKLQRLAHAGWRTAKAFRTRPSGWARVEYRAPGTGSSTYRVVAFRAGRKVSAPSVRRRLTVPAATPRSTAPDPGQPRATSSTPPPQPEHPVGQPDPSAPQPPEVVDAYVAGDIGDCAGAPAQTAGLIPDGAPVLVPGDVAYPNGTRADFENCYLPWYGRFLATTYPVPGNHEYRDPALAYFDVFGARVGTPTNPWYSVQLGTWRFLMLNSECEKVGGCEVGSRQYQWLQQQLAAPPPRCLAVVWHAPRWSSGSSHGSDAKTAPLYRLLQRSGADLVLSGHDHSYERFVRMTASGTQTPSGIRQFVVGTGGAGLTPLDPPHPGSEVRSAEHRGVLRLGLASDGYTWQFLATDGAAVDRGSDTC